MFQTLRGFRLVFREVVNSSEFFGPWLLSRYFRPLITLAWQWYSVALPAWEKWLVGKGVPQPEVDSLTHRAVLVWPGADFGFLALHAHVGDLVRR
jgi:hypothetical protein